MSLPFSPMHEVLWVSVVTSRAPSFNGWGVTAMDSLDTMLLMGLEDEYTRALPMISHTNFSLPIVSPLLLPLFLLRAVHHHLRIARWDFSKQSSGILVDY